MQSYGKNMEKLCRYTKNVQKDIFNDFSHFN